MSAAATPQVAVIGAGPAGLGAAIELERRGISTVTIEQGGIADSIYRYPLGMTFFTTRERVEIAEHPFTIPEAKPSREQALAYYRHVALAESLNLRTFESVLGVTGEDGRFVVRSRTRNGAERELTVAKVVVAVGAFAHARRLDVPGEELDKVSHYYREGHPYAGCRVLVVGAGNSAADAALDLFRCGAEVTLVHRGTDLSQGLKYWIEPDLRNRIREGSIRAFLGAQVVDVRPQEVRVEQEGEVHSLPNDFVFAMTGYSPSPALLESLGVPFDPGSVEPHCDEDSLETSRRGVYVVGAVVAGARSGRVFIENGRFHGKTVAAHIAAALTRARGA